MKFVEHQFPRAYHLKCLSNLSEEKIESGCRDSATSKTVLKQIRYEARKMLIPFEDDSKIYQKSIRNSSVAIGNPERHMSKASQCGSKQQ